MAAEPRGSDFAGEEVSKPRGATDPMAKRTKAPGRGETVRSGRDAGHATHALAHRVVYTHVGHITVRQGPLAHDSVIHHFRAEDMWDPMGRKVSRARVRNMGHFRHGGVTRMLYGQRRADQGVRISPEPC